MPSARSSFCSSELERVGGPHKHEDVLVGFGGGLDERGDAVRAEIRVDGHRILVPRVEVADAVQVVGVGGCRGADVAAFDVAEHVEALLGSVFAGHRVDVHAGGAERLVHGDLRFDGGHDVGDGVDDRAVVFEVGDGQLRGFDFIRRRSPAPRRRTRSTTCGGTSAGVGSSPTTLGFCALSMASIKRSMRGASFMCCDGGLRRVMRLNISGEPMTVASGRPVTCHPPKGVLRALDRNFSGSTVHASDVLRMARSTFSGCSTAAQVEQSLGRAGGADVEQRGDVVRPARPRRLAMP